MLSSSTTRSPIPSASRIRLPESDDLDIGLGLRHADQLDADLVKLPEAPLLRPLVAEHRPAVEKFQRRALEQPVRQHRTDDARRVLRPQGDFFAAAIGKAVHFLGDDIAGLADRPAEDFGELKNRRRDFGKTIKLGNGPRASR